MIWLLLNLLVFLVALGVSLLLCGVARRVGLRLGLMDRPGGRKAHREPIAVTGGWGIFLTFELIVLGGSGAAILLAPHLPESLAPLAPWFANIRGIWPKLLGVTGGTAFIFALGAWDDIRPLRPRAKLACQFLAVVPLLLAGVAIRGFLPEPLGWGLTALWVVLLTNSFNLLDNMDGHSASVAAVICLVLAAAAWQGGELWLPVLFICMAGALGGFLRFNFHPARMFMGDAGALTVGYLMAVFSILITYYQPRQSTALPVLMPLVIMGVPLFDTASVMLIRWRAGKPLMQGDRNHFSHRLLAMGFSVRAATVTIALLTGAVGLLALPLRHLHWPAALLHLAGLAMLFTVIAALEFVGRHEQAQRTAPRDSG